jgi:hypothetical protein
MPPPRWRRFNDRDRRFVNSHRGGHSRLGFAIQLCTGRFLGTFLEDLSEVPTGVINSLSLQRSTVAFMTARRIDLVYAL